MATLKRWIKLFPGLLAVPYLLSKAIIHAVNDPRLYAYISQFRDLLSILYRYGRDYIPMFETLLIIGMFWVVYNFISDRFAQ